MNCYSTEADNLLQHQNVISSKTNRNDEIVYHRSVWSLHWECHFQFWN